MSAAPGSSFNRVSITWLVDKNVMSLIARVNSPPRPATKGL